MPSGMRHDSDHGATCFRLVFVCPRAGRQARHSCIATLMVLILALMPLYSLAANLAVAVDPVQHHCMESLAAAPADAMPGHAHDADTDGYNHDCGHDKCNSACAQGTCCGYSACVLTPYVVTMEPNTAHVFVPEMVAYRSVVTEHDLPPPRFSRLFPDF